MSPSRQKNGKSRKQARQICSNSPVVGLSKLGCANLVEHKWVVPGFFPFSHILNDLQISNKMGVERLTAKTCDKEGLEFTPVYIPWMFDVMDFFGNVPFFLQFPFEREFAEKNTGEVLWVEQTIWCLEGFSGVFFWGVALKQFPLRIPMGRVRYIYQRFGWFLMGHVGKYTIHIDAMGNYGIQDPLVGAQIWQPGRWCNESTSFDAVSAAMEVVVLNSEAMSDSGSQPWKLW